ncbi:MAG: hypothetical protein ACI4XB_00775 [Ruminococcus sp.]
MKKHTASLMTAAMLLTMAWMTGCDSGKVEQTAGDTSSAETTIETTVETTAETIAEESVYEEVITSVEYATYDAFAAAMAEQHPELTMYIPPESVTSTWEWNPITLDTGFYSYSFHDPDGERTIQISVLFNETYSDVQEKIDDNQNYTSLSQSEIVEQTTGYYIERILPLESDVIEEEYVLHGLTGDFNTYYSLHLWYDDGHVATPDELLALREALRL